MKHHFARKYGNVNPTKPEVCPFPVSCISFLKTTEHEISLRRQNTQACFSQRNWRSQKVKWSIVKKKDSNNSVRRDTGLMFHKCSWRKSQYKLRQTKKYCWVCNGYVIMGNFSSYIRKDKGRKPSTL